MDNKRIIEHIRKRKEIDTELWSIKKILEAYDMGMYAQLCCERICDAEKIEQKHVFIDISELGNILVDYIGLAKCSNIISCYIAEEECDKLFDYLFDREEIVRNENRIIRSLRNCKSREIKALLKKGVEKEIEYLIPLMREELKSRRISNRLYQFFKEKARSIYIEIKYYKIFSFLRRYKYERMVTG